MCNWSNFEYCVFDTVWLKRNTNVCAKSYVLAFVWLLVARTVAKYVCVCVCVEGNKTNWEYSKKGSNCYERKSKEMDGINSNSVFIQARCFSLFFFAGVSKNEMDDNILCMSPFYNFYFGNTIFFIPKYLSNNSKTNHCRQSDVGFIWRCLKFCLLYFNEMLHMSFYGEDLFIVWIL